MKKSPGVQPVARLTRLRFGQLRWQLPASVDPESIRELLEHPDHFLNDPARRFKSSRVVTIAVVPAQVAHVPNLVLRRLNYGKWLHRIRDLFRRSRAVRAFRRGLLLEQAGIATARNWAAGEIRHFRWPLKAFLITQEIPDAVTLAALLARNRFPPRPALLRLADLIARLHERGFSHRDLKATNILLDAQLHPWLIDLDGIRTYRKVPDRRAVADLARLARGTVLELRASPFSALRFLERYCQQRNGASCRQLAAAVWAQLTPR